MVITQNGEAKAVVQDIRTYESIQESLALLKILAQGRKEIESGEVKPADDVLRELEERIEHVKAYRRCLNEATSLKSLQGLGLLIIGKSLSKYIGLSIKSSSRMSIFTVFWMEEEISRRYWNIDFYDRTLKIQRAVVPPPKKEHFG